MEAEVTRFFDINVAGSTVLNKKGEQSLWDNEIIGDSFSQQIRDIDKEIRYNENPLFSDTNTIVSNNFTLDIAHDSSREPLKGPRDSFQVHTSPLKNISNISNPSDVADKPSHPMWKRLARLSVISQVPLDDCIGCKRPVDLFVDHYELSSKKLVVSSSDKENYPVLVEIGFQSSCNELHNLKLSGTWEPTRSSRTCRFGPGKNSFTRVLGRNMCGRSQAKLR